MADQAAIQDCNRRIVEGWLPLMPDGDWSVSYLFWGPAGKAVYTQTTALDRSGRMHSLSQPNSVHEALRELRALMSDPQRGAWISAELKLTDAHVLESKFNWDQRFYWGTHPGNPWAPDPDPSVPVVPSDDDYLDELEAHPRELMFLPAWYPRHRVVDGERLDDRALDPRHADPGHVDLFAEARDAAITLPDEVKPLADAWGWPAIFTTINESVLGNMDGRDGHAARALLGEAGEHAHDEAMDALVDDTVASTMLVIDRSPALAAVRMITEWFELRSEQPAVPLASANVGEPLSELLDDDGLAGDAARVARARLESIVRLVAEDNVDDRFGGGTH